ncbi:MAG: hypothetical protein CMG78_12065 [Marinobacter sp.]|nr:hypothetical protein [Marinobacter sp.]
MTDLAGNKFPENGYVEAEDFVADKNMMTGICGTLWGQTCNDLWLDDNEDSIWVVIKVGPVDFIMLDDGANLVKFDSGLVVYCGDKVGAYKHLVDQRDTEEFEDRAITGSTVQSHLPNVHAVSEGFRGRATSEIGGLHAIATARESSAHTHQTESHSIITGNFSEAVALGEDSHCVSLGSNSKSASCGYSGIAVAIGNNSRAFTTAEGGVAVCLEPGCHAAAGRNGTLIMAYLDDNGARRFAIGYIGENLAPNHMYRCDNGKFILVV